MMHTVHNRNVNLEKYASELSEFKIQEKMSANDFSPMYNTALKSYYYDANIIKFSFRAFSFSPIYAQSFFFLSVLLTFLQMMWCLVVFSCLIQGEGITTSQDWKAIEVKPSYWLFVRFHRPYSKSEKERKCKKLFWSIKLYWIMFLIALGLFCFLPYALSLRFVCRQNFHRGKARIFLLNLPVLQVMREKAKAKAERQHWRLNKEHWIYCIVMAHHVNVLNSIWV